jgi:hypothetical protein
MLPCGHYPAEQVPDETYAELFAFLIERWIGPADRSGFSPADPVTSAINACPSSASNAHRHISEIAGMRLRSLLLTSSTSGQRRQTRL